MNFDWGFLWDSDKPSLQSQFDEWLYGDWNEQKYNDYKVLSFIPGVSQYMDYKLDVRADSEYLRRYGMDFTDIHDPRKLSQSASSARLNGAVFNMVSKNVNRLYR